MFLEENAPSLPSYSSQGSDTSIFPMKMKREFLEENIKWQEKMIRQLENERDFLREQVLGKAKGQDFGCVEINATVNHTARASEVAQYFPSLISSHIYRFSQGLRQVDLLQEGITGSSSTLTKLAYRLRGVCKSAIKRMKRRGDLKIGKRHEIVFIDESKFGHKRKYNRGRQGIMCVWNAWGQRGVQKTHSESCHSAFNSTPHANSPEAC